MQLRQERQLRKLLHMIGVPRIELWYIMYTRWPSRPSTYMEAHGDVVLIVHLAHIYFRQQVRVALLRTRHMQRIMLLKL